MSSSGSLARVLPRCCCVMALVCSAVQPTEGSWLVQAEDWQAAVGEERLAVHTAGDGNCPSRFVGHAFIDPATVARASGTTPLVAEGEVPHLTAMDFHRFTPQTRISGRQRDGETQLYFGLSGRCTISAGGGESQEVRRGVSVLVRPGAAHDVSADEPCELVAASLPSGPWRDGAELPAMVVADDEKLPSQRTAHQSSLLSKRVHVKHGLVPGLMQVSIARFEPGAECELHSHASATEVYINYAGEGCHLKTIIGKAGEQVEEVHDLTGGIVDLIFPGTPHDAWNSGTGACENINFMLASPSED